MYAHGALCGRSPVGCVDLSHAPLNSQFTHILVNKFEHVVRSPITLKHNIMQ